MLFDHWQTSPYSLNYYIIIYEKIKNLTFFGHCSAKVTGGLQFMYSTIPTESPRGQGTGVPHPPPSSHQCTIFFFFFFFFHVSPEVSHKLFPTIPTLITLSYLIRPSVLLFPPSLRSSSPSLFFCSLPLIYALPLSLSFRSDSPIKSI